MNIRVSGTIASPFANGATINDLRNYDLLADMKDCAISTWQQADQPYMYDEQYDAIREEITDRLRMSGIKVDAEQYDDNEYYEEHIEHLLDKLTDDVYEKIGNRISSGQFEFVDDTKNKLYFDRVEYDEDEGDIYDFYADTNIVTKDEVWDYMLTYLSYNRDNLKNISDMAVYFNEPVKYREQAMYSFFETIYLTYEEEAKINKILSGELELKEDETFRKTAVFADERTMDIVIHGAKDPKDWYADATLRDKDGNEIFRSEKQKAFYGIWEIETDDAKYFTDVVGNQLERQELEKVLIVYTNDKEPVSIRDKYLEMLEEEARMRMNRMRDEEDYKYGLYRYEPDEDEMER